MELAVKLFKNIYNKQSIFTEAKIRHYNTLVKHEVL